MFSLSSPVLYFYILAAVALRILPHPWNFTPVGAMFLFGAATFRNRWEGLLAALAALAASDYATSLILWQGRSRIVVSSWIAFTAVGMIGWTLRRKVTGLRVIMASLAGGSAFFLLSNLAVWLQGSLYPRTWSGLTACYVAALPFLRNDILGNLVYCAIMFGSYAWIVSRRSAPQTA